MFLMRPIFQIGALCFEPGVVDPGKKFPILQANFRKKLDFPAKFHK